MHTFLSQLHLHCSWFSIWLYSKTLGGDSCSVLSISKTFYPVVHQHPSYCRSQKRLHFIIKTLVCSSAPASYCPFIQVVYISMCSLCSRSRTAGKDKVPLASYLSLASKQCKADDSHPVELKENRHHNINCRYKNMLCFLKMHFSVQHYCDGHINCKSYMLMTLSC